MRMETRMMRMRTMIGQEVEGDQGLIRDSGDTEINLQSGRTKVSESALFLGP